jgi:hypothetical protein
MGPSSEEEGAETFIRAELRSPRFREEVLAGTRGWRIGGLFGGLPAELDWQRVGLTPDEVLSILYIDWTGGSRSRTARGRRARRRGESGRGWSPARIRTGTG